MVLILISDPLWLQKICQWHKLCFRRSSTESPTHTQKPVCTKFTPSTYCCTRLYQYCDFLAMCDTNNHKMSIHLKPFVGLQLLHRYSMCYKNEFFVPDFKCYQRKEIDNCLEFILVCLWGVQILFLQGVLNRFPLAPEQGDFFVAVLNMLFNVFAVYFLKTSVENLHSHSSCQGVCHFTETSCRMCIFALKIFTSNEDIIYRNKLSLELFQNLPWCVIFRCVPKFTA